LLFDEHFQEGRYLLFLLPLFSFVLDVVVDEEQVYIRRGLEERVLGGLGFE